MISFNHSGDIGDMIYAIPTIKALLKLKGKKKASLYIWLNNPQTRLGIKEAEFIKPLLLSQSWCKKVNIVEELPYVDYNLDVWRMNRDIMHRHIALTTADSQFVEVDITKPWLEVKVKKKYDAVLLARSMRNRSKNFKWHEVFNGLNGKFGFVGIPQEYADMKFQGVPYLKVKDALQLAKFIKSCKFFVGNQSFPFALAEAMKVPRLQETSENAPNCMPIGPGSWSSIGLTTNKIKDIIKHYL